MDRMPIGGVREKEDKGMREEGGGRRDEGGRQGTKGGGRKVGGEGRREGWGRKEEDERKIWEGTDRLNGNVGSLGALGWPGSRLAADHPIFLRHIRR